jgi:O-antigen biosynthesis protein WbqP
MLNRIVAVVVLITFSPLFFIVALFVYIEDGTPIFFLQKRVGKNYSLFYIYKFRSMKNDTPNVATHLLIDPDKYLLKIGRILRKLSMDELPNLINIIKGEMVFVGPRPALYNQNDLMDLRVKEGIHTLKPGLTGWAQINGRDEISIIEKVELEKEYLKNKSVAFDLFIIFKTASNVILRKGVKH